MNKLLFAFACLSWSVNAVDADDAVAYTRTALAEYEAAAERCMKAKKNNISITSNELGLLTPIRYSEAIIPYLEQQAFLKCVSKQKLNYTETLILLEKLNESVKNEEISHFVKQQKADNFHLIELEIKLDYMKLPLDTRERLESVKALHTPFDGVKLQEMIWPTSNY